MTTEAQTKPHCPNCRSCEVVPLLDTMPGFIAYDRSTQGRIPAAQCVESEAQPARDWRCQDCGHEWAEAGEAPADK